MKILAITRLFPTSQVPMAGTFNEEQIRRLAEKQEVHVLAPRAWTDCFHGHKGKAVEKPSTYGVTHPLYVYPPRVFRGLHGKCLLASIWNAAHRLWNRHHFHMVYGMFAFPDGWAASKLAETWKVPFVLKVHGSDIHQLGGDPVRRPHVIESLRRAARVVAVSDDLGRQVARLCPSAPVVTVRNGVNQTLFHPGSEKEAKSDLGLFLDDPLVLFVGRLERVKGADLLPKIAAKVKFPAIWVIAGEGPLRSMLQKTMPKGTRFLGVCPPETLASWYRAVRMLVIPSRKEGIPNAMLEALASDRPVVAAQVGGIPEVLKCEKAGEGVVAENSSAFAEAIDKLFCHPLPSGFAHSVVSDWTWKKSAEALEAVFAEVLEK